MEKNIFKIGVKSSLTVSGLGILAGCLVAFFSLFPAHTLWGLAWFSSSTFGFWFFTTSLIVLFSEKHYTAGVNAALYVYFMFFVTGIGKTVHNYLYSKSHGYSYEMRDFALVIGGDFLYGVIPAAMCFVAGFALWFGRKKNPVSVVLRFAPAVFIFLEAAQCIRDVFTRHEMLFMAIVDTVCFVAYILVIAKNSDFTSEKSK